MTIKTSNRRTRAKAVILAAGYGNRLRPLTDHVPKCLVPIAGRPILDFWLQALGDAGVRNILINTHAHHQHVKQYIQTVNRRGGLRIVEAFEPQLLGSAGALIANAEFCNDAETVVVIYPDNLSNVDLRKLLQFHCSHEDPVTMLLFRSPNPGSCGIAALDDEGRVVGFIEKPTRPAGNLANGGIYALDSAAFAEIRMNGGFDIATDVLPRFLGRIRGWLWRGYHRDIGTPEAYHDAHAGGRTILQERGYRPDGIRAAVFFDRDGTLIDEIPYLSDPSLVNLKPGAAECIVALRQSGFACVVVTNQSAVGRGLVSEQTLDAIHNEMCRQLSDRGAVLDAIYYCPVVPLSNDRTVVEHDDRKPGSGLLRRAAEELGLDLAASWIVGDMISDLLAGQNAGCRGSILITRHEPKPVEWRDSWRDVPNITAAAAHIRQNSGASLNETRAPLEEAP